MNKNLLNCLNNNGVLLTPSRRLSAYLCQEYSKLQINSVWATPAIMTLEDYLTAKWQEYEIMGKLCTQLITPMQAIIKIETLIRESDEGKNLYKVIETAKMVYEAWQLMHHYFIDLQDFEQNNFDVQAFCNWITVYQTWLTENHLQDKANWLKTLMPLMCQEVPQHLTFYGFEEFSPLTQQFIMRLKDSDWHIETQIYQGDEASKKIQRSFLDFQQECAAAASWARKMSEKGLKCAVVCPTLTDNRELVDFVFKTTFSPLALCLPQAQVLTDYNISAAVPLSKHPIIAIALKILLLGFNRFDVSDYQLVLNSAFCKGYSEEFVARGMHGTAINNAKALKLDHEFVLTHLQNVDLIQWKGMLEQCKMQANKIPQKASLRSYKLIFENILNLFGWPGDRKLTSVEFQLISRWQALLDELNHYEIVFHETNYVSAYRLLAKLAANTAFQPENKSAKVQVLGVLEAISQNYDTLWIMGLDNEAWPPYVKPNPFIPLSIQTEKGLPHSSQEREMHYAAIITQRLIQSAKEIVFSFSQQTEHPVELSALIQNPQIETHSEDTITLRIEQTIHGDFEIFKDELAPCVSSDENLTGRVKLLETQAICPFKAFAELRLNAINEHEEPIWISAKTNGILFHEVAQSFWQIMKDQKTLLATNELTIQELISAIIDKTLLKIVKWQVPEIYLEAERKRLNLIMQNYLALEKSRKPFTVAFVEQKGSFDIQNVRFNIRYDRIDHDIDGNTIIIDYKTGKSSIKDLLSERLKAPQLPLYYLAHTAEHKAVMYVQLSADVAYTGLSERETDIPGVDLYPEFDLLKNQWMTQINLLVTEFNQGIANVEPIEKDQTCRICKLGAFCRVKEKGLYNE